MPKLNSLFTLPKFKALGVEAIFDQVYDFVSEKYSKLKNITTQIPGLENYNFLINGFFKAIVVCASDELSNTLFSPGIYHIHIYKHIYKHIHPLMSLII